MLFFVVVLSFYKKRICGWLEVVAVGDTLIFKNIAFFRNCLLCLFSRLIDRIVVFGSTWLNDCLLLLYFLTDFEVD